MSNVKQPQHDKFGAAGASLAAFAMRRPVTIGMLFLSMLLFGILASQLLPLEKFPSIDIPEIAIRIPYENATPAEIEKMNIRKQLAYEMAHGLTTQLNYIKF